MQAVTMETVMTEETAPTLPVDVQQSGDTIDWSQGEGYAILFKK
jgi:hypothetical protein